MSFDPLVSTLTTSQDIRFLPTTFTQPVTFVFDDSKSTITPLINFIPTTGNQAYSLVYNNNGNTSGYLQYVCATNILNSNSWTNAFVDGDYDFSAIISNATADLSGPSVAPVVAPVAPVVLPSVPKSS
jgi:hypothetical protein